MSQTCTKDMTLVSNLPPLNLRNCSIDIGAVVRTLITLGKKVKSLVPGYEGPQIQWAGPVTYY